jgi:hypothetical protein
MIITTSIPMAMDTTTTTSKYAHKESYAYFIFLLSNLVEWPHFSITLDVSYFVVFVCEYKAYYCVPGKNYQMTWEATLVLTWEKRQKEYNVLLVLYISMLL